MIRFSPSLTFTSLPSFYEFFESESPFHNGLKLHLRQRLNEVRIAPEAQSFFVEYPDFLNLVALIDEESPDLAILLPIWVRMAELCPRITLRVASLNGNTKNLARLLEQPDLTAFIEETGLPLLCILDEEWRLQTQWGPHPQAAERYLEAWFAEHPEYDQLVESEEPIDQANYEALNDELYHQMRIWYQDKLTRAAVDELQALLTTLREDIVEEEVEEVR